jgi:hypothetical protein
MFQEVFYQRPEIFKDPEFKNMIHKGTENWVPYNLDLDFNNVDPAVRSMIRLVKCTELGQDAEFWGGHYGAQ